MSSHIYGGAVGKKELFGYKACCKSCGAKKEFSDIYFHSFEKKYNKETSINDLARATFPNIKEAYAQRFNLENQIKKGAADLTKEQRLSLIEEPFKVLSNIVEEKLSQTNFDWKSLVYLVLAIVLPFIGFKIFEAFNVNPDVLLIGVSAIFLLMVGIMCYQIYQYPAKYLESNIYPKVINSISVLKPSDLEISEVFGKLGKFNMKIATKGSLKKLLLMNKKIN